MNEIGYVEVQFKARVPKPIYVFLKDYNALARRSVEDSLWEDFECMGVDWTLDFVDGLNHSARIIEKFCLDRIRKFYSPCFPGLPCRKGNLNVIIKSILFGRFVI